MRLKFGMILIIIFAISSCSGKEEKKSKSVKMVKCERVILSNRNFEQRTFPGKITASKDVNLSFRVAGVIEGINIKEGQLVRKNEVVATMDSRDYQIQLNATQAEYTAIKAEAERVIALYKEESISENDYDKAVNGLKAITAKLAAHTNALEDTKLKAPFEGYIQKINFNSGEAVSAGMPVIAFISSSTPEVKINIPTSEYIQRNELLAATATIDLYPNMMFALKSLGTTHKANINHLYETRFAIQPLDGVALTPGMNVMVTLNYENKNAANEVEIPFSAVYERGGYSFVWLIERGKATQREVVVTKIKSDGNVLIGAGIKNGDVVITAGLQSLKEGQEVKALPSSSRSNIGNLL